MHAMQGNGGWHSRSGKRGRVTLEKTPGGTHDGTCHVAEPCHTSHTTRHPSCARSSLPPGPRPARSDGVAVNTTTTVRARPSTLIRAMSGRPACDTLAGPSSTWRPASGRPRLPRPITSPSKHDKTLASGDRSGAVPGALVSSPPRHRPPPAPPRAHGLREGRQQV